MRTQVTLGQYLDVLEEVAWPTVDEDDTLARAHNVVVYKSAKYSIEAPLVVGASLAGASAAQVAALRAVGLPSASPSSCATTCSASTATAR
ncbi:hypothetical protein [Clavibacter tessellarius]|uniref:hypothetical protein n=1 Tax=Clavibacter tessellarius TaxID=31965 RepID=UPI003245A966